MKKQNQTVNSIWLSAFTSTTPTKKMLASFQYLREPIPIRIIINQL